MGQLTNSEIIQLALDRYGLNIKGVKGLPSGINYVYLLDDKYVLKEYIKIKSPQLDLIHSQIVKLISDGLPVPPIITNLKGEYLTKVDGRNIDISMFIEHVDFSDQVHISEENLIFAAETLSTIQEKLDTPEVSSILVKTDFEQKIDTTLNEIEKFKKNFEAIKQSAMANEKQKLDILKELVYSTDLYRAKGKAEFIRFLDQPFKPTHGDYSMVNVLITNDRKIYIIDWDGLSLRPIVWDLQAAISLFSLKEIGNAYVMEPDYTKAALFLKSYQKKSKLSKTQLLLLPEVVKYNFAIYWLSYTLPAVNENDFRLLFLIPNQLDKGLYWVNHLGEYSKFIQEFLNK